jgi:hypothetical protein
MIEIAKKREKWPVVTLAEEPLAQEKGGSFSLLLLLLFHCL